MSAHQLSRSRSVTGVTCSGRTLRLKADNKETELTRQTSAAVFHNFCLDDHEISAIINYRYLQKYGPSGWGWPFGSRPSQKGEEPGPALEEGWASQPSPKGKGRVGPGPRAKEGLVCACACVAVCVCVMSFIFYRQARMNDQSSFESKIGLRCSAQQTDCEHDRSQKWLAVVGHFSTCDGGQALDPRVF